MRGARSGIALLGVAALLGACAVGPDYRRPDVAVPPDWTTDTGWQLAQPSHAALQPDWWKAFRDPVLEALETQALAQNQTLAAAVAHYDQAQATLSGTSAQRLPEIDASVGLARQRVSANRPVTSYTSTSMSTVQNNVQAGLGVSYDTDLFGRLRRQVEGARASAEQAGDDLANARLVLTTQLATAYVQLRAADDEIKVLDESVALQLKALDYVSAQHDLGAVSGLDVLQQQSELDTTRVQARLLHQQRDQYEHAIAALVGVPAPAFSVPAGTLPATLPSIPVGVPSDILQRRPDVASAERAMAAANAQIGVAKAAFFPSLTLNPGIGWQSTEFANLLSAPSLLWTLGTLATQAVFDGGRRQANVDFASAGYRAVEANYRQTVLTAFQQVQDGVTGLSVLDAAARESHAAVVDAQRLLSLATDRYSGGLTAYLSVITAQQGRLASERQDVQIRAQQWVLSVALVKALGGGWQPSEVSADSYNAQR
ncbi:efflux transporter outer membrane subunit [Pandoraea cepalis]|uniref:Toluene efflux pump outer membrane protein TtgF n=1 Tax=Pandoraea cepalis TaxID=2508294 RepID=A0A5E4URI9_9BURK|nr:efflux transporter outer membrane subunit [Pandoraea cepalis]VVE01609.1 Toluene efflux pump outer membrane protein TtgF [Pandoraea cepalis]